jgi:hypothetical protein
MSIRNVLSTAGEFSIAGDSPSSNSVLPMNLTLFRALPASALARHGFPAERPGEHLLRRDVANALFKRTSL